MFGKKSGNKDSRPAHVDTQMFSEGDSTTKDSQGGEVITPQRASDLIGGSSGVSLDGRSLVVPMDREFDEVSSINTAQYGFADGMRVLGTVEHGGDVESITDNRSPNYQTEPTESHHKKQEFQSNKSKKDERTLSTTSSGDGCLPLWITDAPRWLKMVIVLSTALLVGAMILVGVGASLAVKEDRKSSVTTNTNPTSPSFPSAAVPSQAPPTANEYPVNSPSMAPAPMAPEPNSSPSLSPIGDEPTMAPSSSPTSSTVSMFVTGGRFINDALAALPEQLMGLPDFDENTVMFHLGDWNSPFATECDEDSYITNVNLFKDTSVPVYFVPGDNEYNDCPDPDQALNFWNEYLVDFETQFWDEPAWNITRQDADYSSNFAYVNNGVLVVGLNLVGGIVHDNREWERRHTANLEWIDDQYLVNEGDFDVMVILAHADPAILTNDNFYSTFFERVQTNYDVQVVLVNRNLQDETWGLETEFNEIENLMRVVVEGSVWPPLLMQIDTKAGTIDVDQSTWFRT